MNKKTFLRFEPEKQKMLLEKAIKKAGSERKLAKAIGINKGVINNLKLEKRNISNFDLDIILKFLNISHEGIKQHINQVLPSNWGQIKGGKELIRKKRMNGTLDLTIDRLRKATTKRMIGWHASMKRKNPKEYYNLQYSRFKQVGGGYKEKTSSGLEVRNKLEKDVAEFLESLNVGFLYEQYINVNGKVYFPDFIVNRVVIEVTAWKHPSKEKINCLNNKIRNLKLKGYRVYFFIPDKYRKFYKEIGTFIISDLNALQQLIASVA